jgi:uncharacterized membrane protein
MEKTRLEAFSDGVIAIIITIMVLELKVPHTTDMAALWPMIPTLLSYILSFLYVAIYWNNHHHLFSAVKQVNGKVLWANTHLLFWLSLTPFVTAWCGENHFATIPVAAYGIVLLMAAIAYFILTLALLNIHGHQSLLAQALGSDRKGKVSALLYAVGIPLAFVSSYLALAIYAFVAMLWLIPDRRIEKHVHKA